MSTTNDNTTTQEASKWADVFQLSAANLHRLFQSDATHGTFAETGEREANGKVKIEAETIRRAATSADWERHLWGERGLGLSPIMRDNTCCWGCIDVDHYAVDLADMARVARGLPLIVCRSKSGGAHVFRFYAEPQPAADVQAELAGYARDIGWPKAEIFPKQTELKDGRTGNWIIMPGMADALDGNGGELSLEDFLTRAEEIQSIPLRRADEGDAPISVGKPDKERALQRLAVRCDEVRNATEFRNNTLNSAAFEMGGWVGSASISREQAETELRQAALASPNPLPEREIDSLLRRSLSLGEAEPIYAFAAKGRRGDVSSIRGALRQLDLHFRYNQFSNDVIVEGLPDAEPVVDDNAELRVRHMIHDSFGFYPPKDLMNEVITAQALCHPFHPVRDYLAGLTWDGTPRLDRWLVDYGGADDSPYVRAVGSITLMAAVRRVRQPGCKFDEMLILESPQGFQKSTALSTLAVHPDWFSDSLSIGGVMRGGDKYVIEQLSGQWIVEAAELSGIRKADVEHLKAFVCRRVDKARLAYGRRRTDRPRQCIIIGTTNSAEYLYDPTGGRRFWPVAVKVFDLDALARDRDQLWAEAAHREAQGESIRLPKELWPVAAAEQERRSIDNPFVDRLTAAGLGEIEGKIRRDDLWRMLDVQIEKSQHLQTLLRSAMEELGFKKAKQRFGGKLQSGFVRPHKADGWLEIFAHRDEDKGRWFVAHQRRPDDLPF